MRIAIIGSGSVGSGLARGWSCLGHAVVIGSRTPDSERLGDLVAEIGNGVEAAGLGVETGEHAATMSKGEFGVLHGSASYLLQTEDGQVILPHSVSAGLDYPGVGPEHSYLKSTSRVEYVSATDDEAVSAFQWLSEKEGILPALESSHALAFLKQRDNNIEKGDNIIICLSGRGDKDVHTMADYLGKKI